MQFQNFFDVNLRHFFEFGEVFLRFSLNLPFVFLTHWYNKKNFMIIFFEVFLPQEYRSLMNLIYRSKTLKYFILFLYL